MAISKIILNDETQMDITDTTATESNVLSGNVFYAANGVRSVGTYTPAQSDWEEDDSTDPAFILNKPPIIAGEGEESIAAGKISPSNTAAVYTLTINGEANSNTFTYTTEDTLPSAGILKMYCLACYVKSSSNLYRTITNIDRTNNIITLSSALDTVAAITNGTLTIYAYQHKAIGKYSLAEGQFTYSTGESSHAEGGGTKAIGQSSHSEGMSSTAVGAYSHAEGNGTIANAMSSHSEGDNTIAASKNQHVQGKYNIEDASNIYADIIGNGSSSARSNAYTLDWNGNGWFAGKVSAGTIDTPASVRYKNDLTTKEYVDNNFISTNVASDFISKFDFADIEYLNVEGSSVNISKNIQSLYSLFASAVKTYFMVPLSQTEVIPMEISHVDMGNGIINLFAIINDKKYTIDLHQEYNEGQMLNGMSGTLNIEYIAKPAFFGGQWINYGDWTTNPQYGSHILLTNYYIDGTLYNTSLLLYAIPDYEISNTNSPLISLYKGYTESGIAITYEKDNSSPYHPVWNWDAGEHSIAVNQAYVYMPKTIPSASSTTPLADGAAAVGTSTTYARADHVHPVSSMAALSDTNISSPSTGQALVYDNTSSKWVNVSVSASDIGAIPAPQAVNDGQFLKYKQLSQDVYGWGVTDLYAELNDTSAVFYELEPTNVENQFMIEATFSDIFQTFSSTRKAYFIYTDSSTGYVVVFIVTDVDVASYTITLTSISTYNIARINLQVDSSTGHMKGTLEITHLSDRLSDLSDVNFQSQSLSNGQVLTYNETSSKWVNSTLSIPDPITIDTTMSSSSTNPVTNSAITTAIANNRGKVFYGVVDNTSTATAFTAQIPGITAYEEGLVVILKNGVVTSASGFTININGLGALPVYNNLGAASRETTIFNVAYTMMFVYEHRVSGGDWLCYRGSDANTNTIGYQLRTNSMSLPMKSVTYRYRLLFTSADGAHFVPANNTTSTNATASRAVCQDKIDPFGPIYYYGTTASVGANSRPSATYLWEQYTIALGYSFNRTGAALTLTPWAPVYVKCAPQADGSAIIDSTTPYVQVLPTTADGKIYIFLGVAYSATNIELVPYHPVYCYRNGGIQIWTGTQSEIDTINTRIDGCVTTEELDDALANLPSGGGSTAPTLLGNTPVKLTEDTNIKLNASGSCTYTLEGDTVADFDILHGTTVKATITFEDSVYKLKAGSDASAWYNTYIDIFVDGLTVGTAYTFVFDADGCTFNTSQHITVGHYILYDNSGNTLVTRGSTDSNSLNSYAFTASTTKVKLRWYPSISSYYSAGVSVATVNRIYINKAGTTEHTSIVNSSGSFTDTVELGSVSRGVTISSTPVAAVYKVASSGGGSSKPLEGKTIVVFGDSLIGMYRGETSATAYIKNVTGATVYNVGFGGCRMATHPTNGYAQFSMWALADAVASGVWTSQDQYASSGSDYFAEQLATLKSIDFNNVDYVVIHYGTNDFGGGVPLGFDSPSTDCTTFCGAARHSIETLLSAYPKLRIYISLPVYRYWESGGVITYAETYQNSQNVILLEYISALTTIATEYYLPIIDGYHELGINRLNASTFLSDGTHHNAIGRRRFGEFIGSKIISSM